MAYKCVHCSKVYDDGSKEILEGCECKSKFFFYIKDEKLKEIELNKEIEPKLTTIEKEQMEEDVREIASSVLRHRIVRNYKAEAEGVAIDTLISELMK